MEINKLCKKFNIPIQAASIQFPLKNKNVSSIILGMDQVNQINENLKYLNIKIDKNFWDCLEKIL